LTWGSWLGIGTGEGDGVGVARGVVPGRVATAGCGVGVCAVAATG